MENESSPKCHRPPSAHSQPDDGVFPGNRLVAIVDAYPDNLVVQYFMWPFARHFFKSLLAVFICLYGSLFTCMIWFNQKVCDRMFSYSYYVVGTAFFVLTCYSAYLRRKLERQSRLSREG
ncbi:hypothetical protein BJX61DRAFT_526364 [Aspergillus egyptiacus]|nr:hypothetical protein BJX61DRAFT_526364 [Aspergillus egyptiacus]